MEPEAGYNRIYGEMILVPGDASRTRLGQGGPLKHTQLVRPIQSGNPHLNPIILSSL